MRYRTMRLKRVFWCVATLLLLLSVGVRAGVLIGHEQTWNYFEGTEEASDPRWDWRRVDFDDSGWSSGQAPIGYGEPEINTTLTMQGNYSSFFIRKKFTVGASDLLPETRLRATVFYDDGYIIWINGEQVGDRGEPDGEPLHDSLAPVSREDTSYETNNLGDAADVLTLGTENVIAVQVFNGALGSGDCKIDVSLSTYKRVADTTFSADRGFYESPFDVTIRTATPGATIRYTTDGSEPTASNGSGTGTNEVVTISSTTCLRARAMHDGGGYEPSDVDTQTYIFLDSVLAQTRLAGYPADVWAGPTQTNAADYDMDGSVTGLYSRAAWSNAFRAIPTMSLVMDKDDMFATSPVGIYAESRVDVRQERGASVELIYPRPQYDEAHEGFQIDCGLKMHGANMQKHSFRLLFTRDWGPSKLEYPLFETDILHARGAADRFDRIVVRAGCNDGWAGSESMDPATYTMTRDQWARDAQLDMTGDGSHGIFVHLFINGMYWGLHNPAERPDHAFTSEYFGGEKEHWFATNHGYQQGEPPINPDSGNQSWFGDLMTNAATMSYSDLVAHLDVEQFSDYILLAWYDGNGDWANNNWYIGHYPIKPDTGQDAPCMFFTWDAEKSWYNMPAQNTFEGGWVHSQFAANGSYQKLAVMWQGAFKHQDFRMVFADRIYKHCFNDGALTDANSLQRWAALSNVVDKVIICESARWGDVKDDLTAGSDVNGPYVQEGDSTYPVYTREEHWRAAMARIGAIMEGNVAQFIQACRTTTIQSSSRYSYPLIDPPGFHQHGGVIGSGFRLTMTNPNGSGTIFYKTDGSDPRALGGGIASGAENYNTAGAPALARTSHVKARVYQSSSTWSAVRAATYNYTAHYPNIRITEIHYNPFGGGDYEFIEVKNVSGSITVGLSEMTFSGLNYTFEPTATLAPGKFAVLVRNEAVFTNRYPAVKGSANVDVFGAYRGALDNGGERIKLLDNTGVIVAEVRYNDRDPWPEESDGDGFSLVYTGTDDAQDDPAKWRASNLMGGSPGADDGDAYRVVISEALTHTDLPAVDAIELQNIGESGADIGGWYLSDSDADYKKYQIPSYTLPAGGFKVYDETDFNTDTNDPSCFALNSHGDEVYLTKWDGTGHLQYLAEARFGGAANGVAFGRHVMSDGDIDFVAQSVTNTLGSSNAYPRVGPVVITELMYHPTNGGMEYIELLNIAESATALYEASYPTNTWMLDGAVDYVFPTGTVLSADETIIVAPTNDSAFRAAYPSVPGGVRIFGPYAKVLDDAGESVKLWRPDAPDTEGVPRILVDRVKSNDNAPWPESPDGDGLSLQRNAAALHGNDPANWCASTNAGGTPGEPNPRVLLSRTAGWRFHDRGEDLGTGWRAASYDHSGWDDGNAPLGYPDTNPQIDTVMDYGDDPSGKYTTTYFRAWFMLGDAPGDVTELLMRIRYDDGYVAYLNGQEVSRGGMPGGAITHHTLANTSNGSQGNYALADLGAHTAKLVKGLNLFAVEIHQINATSSDIFMDLELCYDISTTPKVSTPQISPPGGAFGGSVGVTITTATSGATIFYTTDGSDPDGASSNGVDSVDFTLFDSATVKAIAKKAAMDDSNMAQATFTKDLPDVATPVINPDGGTFYQSVPVTIMTATAGATVFYTTDGSTPDAGDPGAVERVDFVLASGATVKAKAFHGGSYDPSSTASATLGISASDEPVLQWVAYNDLAWTNSQTEPSTTHYTPVNGSAAVLDTGGELISYSNGSGVDAFLVLGVSGVPELRETRGENPASSTDGYALFYDSGKGDYAVDLTGTIRFRSAADLVTLTFTNLNPLHVYDVAVYGDYYSSGYDGSTETAISDVESYRNMSSVDATLTDSTIDWGSPNDVNGYVARFGNVRTGPDGDFTLSLRAIAESNTRGYFNGFVLKAYAQPATPKAVQGGVWRYRKGTAEASAPVPAWRGVGFDDSGWATGAAAFGYNAGTLGTQLGDMQGGYSSLFLRREFQLADPTRVLGLELWADYDDGCVVWVNGAEVARLNVDGQAGDAVAHTDTASGSQARTWSRALSGSALPELLEGTNVLAVQGFNSGTNSGDFRLDVSLAALENSSLPALDDADGDGMPDNWEVGWWSNTNKTSYVDSDLDGLFNIEEWIVGTCPTNPGVFFQVDVSNSGAGLIVSFDALEATGTGYAGLTRYYCLEERADLNLGGAWLALPGYESIVGSGQTVCYTNTMSTNRNYRGRAWLQ